ncbi:Uncharacterised protein [Vibrio cholerae]|uniref:Uncharacterized protein n=1 Tax=Vibrio cholerae TaxID=666 RepID=A0A655ZCA0_VIBCL|nr:Uncharacterised protein [Vibrio cholerae]CSA46983.1 Uncharacterised protein [Vibrio cholerae]CSC67114.1 Uncharacterised protein [Vibrio cholerae]CSI83147.1 Uncharacterised protein [Vibrio cholerae]
MRRALHLIQHMQVIRQNTCIKQGFAERHLCVNRVIDPFEQHTLIE